MATDGLWDNLFDEEVQALLRQQLQKAGREEREEAEKTDSSSAVAGERPGTSLATLLAVAAFNRGVSAAAAHLLIPTPAPLH